MIYKNTPFSFILELVFHVNVSYVYCIKGLKNYNM